MKPFKIQFLDSFIDDGHPNKAVVSPFKSVFYSN
jgi:hypothetical protein